MQNRCKCNTEDKKKSKKKSKKKQTLIIQHDTTNNIKKNNPISHKTKKHTNTIQTQSELSAQKNCTNRNK